MVKMYLYAKNKDPNCSSSKVTAWTDRHKSKQTQTDRHTDRRDWNYYLPANADGEDKKIMANIQGNVHFRFRFRSVWIYRNFSYTVLKFYTCGWQIDRNKSGLMMCRCCCEKIKTSKFLLDKKVLLRERKRHTDRSVSSTPYAVLSRGGEGGYLPWGTLPVLTWPRGYLPYGIPSPILTWPQGRYSLPLAKVGTPCLELAGVPPPRPQCGQTENITFPHPSHAVGKNSSLPTWWTF